MVCSVAWGAEPFAPPITPFGKLSTGCVVLPGMSFRSFSFVPANSQLSLALNEWNVLVLVVHVECAARGPAPLGDELPSYP